MIEWNELSSPETLSKLSSQSFQIPVIIFKHSSRCFISQSVLQQVEENWPFGEDEVQAYFLDLIAYRSISNQIAEEFDVQHQSPQLIALKDGEVVYHDSHHQIDLQSLTEQL